jgi:hypothetical protein
MCERFWTLPDFDAPEGINQYLMTLDKTEIERRADGAMTGANEDDKKSAQHLSPSSFR